MGYTKNLSLNEEYAYELAMSCVGAPVEEDELEYIEE
jgi:hypothetical protein